MIHLAHFATRQTLQPLLRMHGVFVGHWQTWNRAPKWLRKMWEVAGRHRHRRHPLREMPQRYFYHHKPKDFSGSSPRSSHPHHPDV